MPLTTLSAVMWVSGINMCHQFCEAYLPIARWPHCTSTTRLWHTGARAIQQGIIHKVWQAPFV